MYRTARISLLAMVMGLSACAVQPPAQRSEQPIPSLPSSQPGTPRSNTPQTPAAPQKTSSHFAPPPGGHSHWDERLGVHVLDNASNTFYRQRTYYRWDNGWTWALSPDGPWQATDGHGVPPGLSRQFGN